MLEFVGEEVHREWRSWVDNKRPLLSKSIASQCRVSFVQFVVIGACAKCSRGCNCENAHVGEQGAVMGRKKRERNKANVSQVKIWALDAAQNIKSINATCCCTTHTRFLMTFCDTTTSLH